ncbi:MAG: hypothetical protein JWP97_5824 [Labilithrix sp.]|nr:hypothetical protein [Labilithrix sp.]
MRVTETMGPAWETMKRVLFRPFNLGTWFSFGLVFFLQSCVEGSGSFNLPNGNTFGGKSHGSGGGHGDTSDSMLGVLRELAGLGQHAKARGPLVDALSGMDTGMMIGIAVVAVIVAIPLVVLAYWLGTRGQMMAIRAVAEERCDVGTLWRETKPAGTLLFKFQLVLVALSLVVVLPLAGVGAVAALPVIRDGQRIETVLPLLLGLGALLLLVMLPLSIVSAMARNFVAPLMLKHGLTARQGWVRFWAVGKQHVGSIIGFFCLRFAVYLGATLVGTLASLLTCCLGFLPVLHQTLMAPYFVFERAWTLEALASMSADFDVRRQGGPMPPQGPWQGGPAPYNPYAGTPQHNPYAPPGYGGGYDPGGQGGPPPGGFGSPT